MLNLVCAEKGRGEAVLIRAVEPVEGTAAMRRWRGTDGVNLSNGPGKLAEALDVDDRLNGVPASGDSPLRLFPAETGAKIYQSPRVGINRGTERYWRFFIKNKYISKVKENEFSRRRD